MQNRTRLISCEVMLPTLSTNNITLLHVPQYWEQTPISLEKKYQLSKTIIQRVKGEFCCSYKLVIRQLRTNMHVTFIYDVSIS